MGVRVRKFLGYGLTDVQTDEKGYEIEDLRIDADSMLLGGGEAIERAYSNEMLDEYLHWLDAKYEDADRKIQALEQVDFMPALLDRWWLRDPDARERRPRRHIGDCCAWEGEYGISEVLVLQPLACADWQRYDDPIDYAVETYLLADESQANRVEVFSYGLYPWNGTYMDARTGEKVDVWPMTITAIRRGAEPQPEYLEKLGVHTAEELLEVVVPVVPAEVRDLAEFCGLFTDDEVWLQLRPLIYTYWS